MTRPGRAATPFSSMNEAIADKKSYRQILKATSIMGGSSLIIILFRIVRTKFLAVLLGPSGIGLIGIYDSIIGVVNCTTAMGIASSGVRQIAEAVGSDDEVKISRTVTTLRRTVLFSGLLGFCAMLFSSGLLSRLTFGDQGHASDLALLAVTIFFSEVSGGQAALIQGARRIKDLAMMNILGAFLGTLFSIPIFYVFGHRGIILYMLIVSAMSLLTSWWYSRKMKIIRVVMSWRETLAEAKPLLKLGLAFMFSGLMTTGTFYLLRVCIVRYAGLDGAGIYQAAAGLSLLYTGFILEAMGRDYYPRLTAVAGNGSECNSLINKQMEIGVLLAVPGIIGTMTFTPFVISIFYSAKFLPAVDVLRWQILGILLRVIIWPMSYLFVAKGNGKLFFWTELFANATHLLFVLLGVKYFGLTGAGMAFFAMYVLYFLVIYRIVRASYGYVMTGRNLRILAISITSTALVFLTPFFLPSTPALIVNIAVTAAVGWYSLNGILSAAGPEMVPEVLLKVRAYFNG